MKQIKAEVNFLSCFLLYI